MLWRVVVVLAMVNASTSLAGQFSSFQVNSGGVAPPVTIFPTLIPWFGGALRNGSLNAFIAAGKQPGINVIEGGSNTYLAAGSDDYALILGAGYQQMGGLAGDVANCALDDPYCFDYAGLAGVKANIDQQATYRTPAQCIAAFGPTAGLCSGATFLYINEPCMTDNDYTPTGTFTANASWSAGGSIAVQGALPSWITTALAAPYTLRVGDKTNNNKLGLISSVSGTSPWTINFSGGAAFASSGTNDTLFIADWCSIPYHVQGDAIVWNYIHNTKGYNIKIGPTASYGPTPTVYQHMMTWAQSNSYNPYQVVDFLQDELYGTEGSVNSWSTFHAAFPNHLRSTLFYTTKALCSNSLVDLTNTDMIGFWSVDNYTADGTGPDVDPEQLSMLISYGATGSKSTFCNQTTSYFSGTGAPGWATQFSNLTTLTAIDGSYPGWTSPYTISGSPACDYQVYSGPHATKGLLVSPTTGAITVADVGTVQTLPATAGTWASRTCNAALPPITIGAGQNCRDETTDAITASISGTTLTVTSGPPTNPIVADSNHGTAIFGAGVTAGTKVVGYGSGGGGAGTYTLNNSMTVASESMTARRGFLTCIIIIRNHNTSSIGFGHTNYYNISVAF
jgi:hypothetical protein